MDINLKTLIGKLNDTTRTAATRAAALCVGMGQYEVDIEHLFLALLEQPACDVAVAARACGISATALEADLCREVDGFARGSARTPVFSRHLPTLLEHAWLIASLGAAGPAQLAPVWRFCARPPEARLREAHARFAGSGAGARRAGCRRRSGH
jgi:type VI secretion system protein VasG